MLAENARRRSNDYWRGADLVMEVVSKDDPERDVTKKRAEYAKAGIREYWIVDPRDKTITVLGLNAPTSRYEVIGKYAMGDVARSVLLDGFTAEVHEVFSQW
jgi:Uma2 family endonuclease